MKHVKGLVPLVLLGALLVSCSVSATIKAGGTPTHDSELSGAGSTVAPTPLPVGTPFSSGGVMASLLATERNYPGVDVRLTPLLPAPTPETTAGAAVHQCSSLAAPCPAGLPSRIEYGLFSDDAYGDRISTPYPAFQNVPAWILTWHDVPCDSFGGPGPLPGVSAPSPIPKLCDTLALFRGSTGAFLLQVQSAPAPTW